MVHHLSNKGCGMCCPVGGKVHIKDPLLPIEKSSLCGYSRFPLLRKYITMTICLTSNSRYENQCAPEASLNKSNIPFLPSAKCGTSTVLSSQSKVNRGAINTNQASQLHRLHKRLGAPRELRPLRLIICIYFHCSLFLCLSHLKISIFKNTFFSLLRVMSSFT